MDELISRKEAMDAVKNVRLNITIKGRRGFTKFNKELQEITTHILDAQQKALKEIEPKAVYIEVDEAKKIHAAWERGFSFPDGPYWKCTNCGELIRVKIPMKYCNNCGAKMDKEAADEAQ